MENFLFSLHLVKYGILSGIFLGLALSLTSPFLILKKNALFPHALTHVLFFAIILTAVISEAIPSYLEYPLIAGITLLAVLTILIFKKCFKFYEDTATSIITHLFLGLALIIATKTYQYDARLLSYLFGSLVTVTKQDFYQSLIIFLLSLALFFKFYPLWVAQITDEELPGIDYKWANFFYLIAITLQILIGIKLMGVLLISTFFVFSGSVALRLSPNLKIAILITALLNVLGILGGSIISIFWDLPFSGSVVVFMSFYFIFLFIMKLKTTQEE
jgi:zinc transport system permease protein